MSAVAEVAKEQSRFRNLYRSSRTALLNRKYYGNRLVIQKMLSFLFAVAIGIGTSAAIGGWAI